jgi:hypothetical protein
MPLTNQDKREMLEIFSECLQGTKNAKGKFDVSLLHSKIHTKILSLREDKPEREMPKVGKRVLWLSFEPNRKFEIFPARWGNTHSDRLDWEAGLMFSDLDIALAEKKCADLNEILRR